MPAEDKEVEGAINEGIEFLFQNNVVKIIVDKENKKAEKTNDDERTNDSRDASISDSEVSSNGQRGDVPRADGLVAEKNGSCGCLSF